MKKWWLIALGLIVLIVAGVMIYVVSIDWNEHKNKIAGEISQLTGKRVVFEGPVSLSIFPSPYLTAEKINIYSQDKKIEEPLVTLKSLVARLELIPFIKGEFKVKKMSLVEPVVRMEVFDDGSFNWKSDLSPAQRRNLEEVQVTLDSVAIENASLSYINRPSDINWEFTNLNAEVIASSVFGPYRIEGSYVKDNNPEGFAISMGRISEDVVTVLNFAFNNPATSTYFRFDGSVLFNNEAANGTFVFESKKLMDFVNTNFKDFRLDKKYDKPLAMSMTANLDKDKVNLSDLVVKYGDTAAAGNVIIPRLKDDGNWNSRDKQERQRIEMAFNLTDLEIEPVAEFIKERIKNYADSPETKFELNLDWDVIADIKAVKAGYKGQNIKNLVLSFDIVPDKMNINNLQMVLPGETSFKAAGSLFPNKNGVLSYNFDTTVDTDNFIALLKWAEMEPVQVTKSVYKKVNFSGKVNGNINQVKVSPFTLGLDNSSIKGSIGAMRAARPRFLAMLEADNVNFDNYVSALSSDLAGEPFDKRLQQRLSKLSFLKNYDISLMAKLGLGIYESTPFENLQLAAMAANGRVNVKNLSIGNLAAAKLSASGIIDNIDTAVHFDNLQYTMTTKDLGSFVNKFEINIPRLNTSVMKSFNAEGTVTGGLRKFYLSNKMKLENFEAEIAGDIDRDNPKNIFFGSLKLRDPDFIKMLNNFGVNYKPNVYSLGIFALSGKFKGNLNNFVSEGFSIEVGQNSAWGSLYYNDTNGRPLLGGNLGINQFEFERFFYSPGAKQQSENKVSFIVNNDDKQAFLGKPGWSPDKINYDFYNSFDMAMDLKIGRLMYNNKQFEKVDSKINLNLGNVKISDLSAKYKEASITGNLEGKLATNPTLKADIEIKDLSLEYADLIGRVYGIEDGKLRTKFMIETSADSTEEMVSKANGEASFEITDTHIKGWNMEPIIKDLRRRKVSDGLAALVKTNLSSGMTPVNKISGMVVFKNGAYSFKDAKLSGENFNMTFTAEGNLPAWDLMSQFDVKPDVPEKLQNFSFTLAGSLNAPVLEVNVKTYTDKYDEEKNRIAAEQRAKEQAVMDALKDKMDKLQQTVKIFEGNLYKVNRDFERFAKKADNQKAKDVYDEIRKDIEGIRKKIADVSTLALLPKYDDKVLNEGKVTIDTMIQELEKVKDDIQKASRTDLKSRINEKYNAIVKVHGDSQKKISEFRLHKDEYSKRLKLVKSDYDINSDDTAKALALKVENLAIDIVEANEKMAADYPKMQSAQNPEDLDKFEQSTLELQKKVDADNQALEESISQFNIYAEEKVFAIEDAYHKAVREAEVKRKVAENTGKISVKGEGKARTVVRDIEEIEKAEKLQEKSEVKVLDFTKKKQENVVMRKGQKSVSKGTEKPKSFLKKSSGTISKASGVIIKK